MCVRVVSVVRGGEGGRLKGHLLSHHFLRYGKWCTRPIVVDNKIKTETVNILSHKIVWIFLLHGAWGMYVCVCVSDKGKITILIMSQPVKKYTNRNSTPFYRSNTTNSDASSSFNWNQGAHRGFCFLSFTFLWGVWECAFVQNMLTWR